MGLVSTFAAASSPTLEQDRPSTAISGPQTTMMTSLSVLLLVSLISSLCQGAIWDCGNKHEGSHPQWATQENARKCADEGGKCFGPGRVYFGDALTWTYKYVDEGRSINCNTRDFGCDPLPWWKKSCYFVPECELKHCCSAYTMTEITESWTFTQTIPAITGDSCDHTKQKILKSLFDGQYGKYHTSFSPTASDRLFNEDLKCRPC